MKLKPIPLNTVVHTPTEEEAKELLAILHENGWDVSEPFDGIIKETEGILVRPEHDLGWWGDIHFAKSIGHTILTLAEFKDKYVDLDDICTDDCISIVHGGKILPLLSVGDKVEIQESYYKEELRGQIGIVTGRPTPFSYYVEIDKTIYQASAKDLEPYPEPETKPTEDMETKEKESGEKGNYSEISQSNNLSQDVANCDKPEDKELNLSELLKGHEGETFYSPIVGDCTLKAITDYIHIAVNDHPSYCFFLDGRREKSGAVVFFPSRALYEQYPLDAYTAWSVWDDKQYIHRLAVSLYTDDEIKKVLATEGNEKVSGRLTAICRFKTPADRDKCLGEIQAIIEKYSKK
jgi:hypothetical protein